MPIPAEQSSFPTSIDTFTSLSDLPPSLVTSAARYQYLKTKETLTSEEAAELSVLTTTLQNYLITPSRWNKFQNCLISMESFISNSWQNYYQYRGIWSVTPDPVYEIYNSVKYNDEVYLAITVPSTNLPTNTTYWVKIGSKGDKGTIWTGNYNPATTYDVDDLIFFEGTTYICILQSTGNAPTNPIYFSIFAQKGETGSDGNNMVFKNTYDPSVTYNPLEYVEYDGALYYCKQITTGNVPTNTIYWGIYLARGASVTVSTLRNTVSVSTNVSNVPIGITSFNKNLDSLFVYVNSTYLEIIQDYTINVDGLSIDKVAGTWDGTVMPIIFNFVVIKNIVETINFNDGTLIQNETIHLSALAQDAKPYFSITAPVNPQIGQVWIDIS